SQHVEDRRANGFGANNRDQRERGPKNVAREMAGQEQRTGPPSASRADSQQRQKRRPRSERVGAAGDGGGEQQAWRQFNRRTPDPKAPAASGNRPRRGPDERTRAQAHASRR